MYSNLRGISQLLPQPFLVKILLDILIYNVNKGIQTVEGGKPWEKEDTIKGSGYFMY